MHKNDTGHFQYDPNKLTDNVFGVVSTEKNEGSKKSHDDREKELYEWLQLESTTSHNQYAFNGLTAGEIALFWYKKKYKTKKWRKKS